MPKNIVVVGGVAGGASFAARMRRLDEHAAITIYDKGDYVSFANCGLPYYIGGVIKEHDDLVIQTPQKFRDRFNVDVRLKSEVTGFDAKAKSVTVRSAQGTVTVPYDVLVLSPGSAPVVPPIPGIKNDRVFTLRTIPDMDRIREAIDSRGASRAVVVGGGFIGLEMAENLRHRGLEVTQVELTDQLFAPADREMAVLLHQHLMLNGVEVLLGDGVAEFAHSDAGLTVRLNSGRTLPADIAVLAIGVSPDTRFARDSGVEVSQRGAIVVDNRLRTNLPDVYAVGDAIEVTDFVSGKKVHVPLAGPANRQGRIAADNIAGIDSVYRSTQGTAICKVFDLTAAVTGLNEKNAKRWGIPYVKSYIHSASHAGYYPGAFPLSIKILFSPDNGRLLGAQVVGKEGIDKRIDVLATALRHGLTVDDLSELELAYAPPFGSARDPVNIAGFVARNILSGRMPVVYAEDRDALDPQKNTLLDVRTAAEREQGEIPGSVHIAVDELRRRFPELDKSKPVTVYCQIGLRAYVAVRMLLQHGFTARNLSGGYKTWAMATENRLDTAYLKPVTEPVCSSPTSEGRAAAVTVVDACGLQCPGPIMKLKEAADRLRDGESLEIRATDQGFALDVPSWCSRTKNSLVSLGTENGVYRAVIRKGAPADVCGVPQARERNKTMVIFSNDFDKMMAAFIIANGAAAMGSSVTLFFTFWGLNLLRRDTPVKVSKSIVERMFGMMMPRGPQKTTLSKMNMAGMGNAMIRWVMRRKNVYGLPELIASAQKNGVRLVACTMSMDIMGIKKEELIDGVEFGGVSHYLEKADNAAYNLFI